MSWFTVSVVYFMSWWIVLLMVLPIGVRNHHEEGIDMDDGFDRGAPVHHMLPKKALWATIGAAIVTLVIFLIVTSGIIPRPQAPWG